MPCCCCPKGASSSSDRRRRAEQDADADKNHAERAAGHEHEGEFLADAAVSGGAEQRHQHDAHRTRRPQHELAQHDEQFFAYPARKDATAAPETSDMATNNIGISGVFHTGRFWCTVRSKPV